MLNVNLNVKLPLTLAFLALVPSLQAQQPCTLHLTLDARGRINEFHHRLSHDVVVHRLKTACPVGAAPMQVFVTVSPRTQYGAVKNLMDLVQQVAPPGTQFGIDLPKNDAPNNSAAR